MNSITVKRENGNVPKSLPGEDHVSGIIFYVDAEKDVPEGFKTEPINAVSTIDGAEALGITPDAESWIVRVMHYTLSEIYRLNASISLYVGVYVKGDRQTFSEVKALQNYANGAIRQVAIWNGSAEITGEDVATLDSIGTALDLENAPLSIGIAPKVADFSALPLDLAVSYPRVSVIIGQAGSGLGASLYTHALNERNKYAVSCIGVWLGHVSSAAVHESISWVKKFPSGISLPALSDGTLVRNIDKAWIEKLDTARYNFLTPIVGVSGSYWNDSCNMDAAISDYNAIELVRTMDKAVRGVRSYLTPELGGNVYIDTSTGKMQAFSVAHLETTANKALEDMEKAGELSGYKVEIDPEQDVLSTSEVEIVIKQVAVGVMRKIKVRIGFAKSV